MNNLKIFNSAEFGEIRTIQEGGSTPRGIVRPPDEVVEGNIEVVG